MTTRIALAVALLASPSLAWAGPDPLTVPIPTPYAAQWMAPQTPQQIWGDTYYVGTGGLSVVLIRTSKGMILIDASMPQSVPMIEAHIRQLGFNVRDVRYILVSEPHFDHAGGVAALARDTGAVVVASPATARVLRTGRPAADDPQAGQLPSFPAVGRIREIADGGTVQLGGVTLTARYTPGHTPGSTSWTWKSCEQGKCLDVVFAASLNAVSADGFRFSDSALPDVFRRSSRRVAALPCDILISGHPDNSGADAKLKALETSRTPNPFIDPAACRAYATRANGLLETRLSKERGAR